MLPSAASLTDRFIRSDSFPPIIVIHKMLVGMLRARVAACRIDIV